MKANNPNTGEYLIVCTNHECKLNKMCNRYQAQMPEADCVTHNFTPEVTPEGANCIGFLDYPEMYKFLIK
jgi:hypothetical protein